MAETEAVTMAARQVPDFASEVSLAKLSHHSVARRPPSLRRMVVQSGILALVVLALVTLAGVEASGRIATQEAINDAREVTDLVAETVIQPVLTDDLITGSPDALARLDAVTRTLIRTRSIVRVKLWTQDGRVIYSDESRLIGRTFPLNSDERAALAMPSTRAELSDLSRSENQFERSQGRLLEVYRPVWTPGNVRLLFETYSRYSEVTIRSRQLWQGFAGVMLGTVLAMIVMTSPLAWTLFVRLRRLQRQREEALARAVEASDSERRRIAATLHDGVVQELAAISYVVSTAADSTAGTDRQLADRLRVAAGGLRASIGGLRSLLVDVYPPALRAAGIVAALTDLAGMLRPRGIEVDLDLADHVELDERGESLVFRIAQEIIRNIGRHSGARSVCIRLACSGTHVVLTIADDGVGFDPRAVLASPREGHFGLALMTDLATDAGAALTVASAPDMGTQWRLVICR